MSAQAPERDIRVLSHEGWVFGCDCNPEQWPRDTWHEDVLGATVAGALSVPAGAARIVREESP